VPPPVPAVDASSNPVQSSSSSALPSSRPAPPNLLLLLPPSPRSYFIPTDGDDEAHPNIFLLPSTQQPPLLLSQVRSSFPLPGAFHYRAKTNLGKGHVWLDVVDGNELVPSFRQASGEQTITLKLTRLEQGGECVQASEAKRSERRERAKRSKRRRAPLRLPLRRKRASEGLSGGDPPSPPLRPAGSRMCSACPSAAEASK
jgi:hypothetical protein